MSVKEIHSSCNMKLNRRSHSSIASPPSITPTISFNGVTFVNRTSATMKNQWYHTVNIHLHAKYRVFMALPKASPLKKNKYKRSENCIIRIREQIGNL